MPDMAMLGLVDCRGEKLLDAQAMSHCAEYLTKVLDLAPRDRCMQGWAAHMYFFFITNMLFQGTTETVHKYVMTVCEALAPVKDMRQGVVESFIADLITVRENSNVNLMAPNSSDKAIFHHNLRTLQKVNGVVRTMKPSTHAGDWWAIQMHATPSSLNEVSLQLEIISAWWDFHDFDKDGEPVSMSGKPGVADTYIWAADVMMEKGTRPPALLETGAVRAHNDQIQNSIAIDNVPIELSDSDSD